MIVPAVTRLQALEEFTQALSSSLSASELVELAVDKARLGTGADAAEVFLVEESSQESFLVCHGGLYPEAFHQISHFPLGEGYPGLVAARGELIITERLPEDKRYLRTKVKEAGFHSYLCLPLFLKTKVVGCLNIAIRSPEQVDNDDRQLLESIASSLSLALAAGRWQLAEVLTRWEGNGGIRASLEEVADTILGAVATNCRSQGAALWFATTPDRAYRLLATWGIAKIEHSSLTRLSAKCAALNAPQFFSCFISSCPFATGSTVCYPLRHKSKTLGILSLSYPNNNRSVETFSLVPGAALLSALILDETRRDSAYPTRAAKTERQRLLREIHDGLLQNLGLLRVKADYISQLREYTPEKLAGELEALRYLASNTSEEFYRIVHGVPPGGLEDGGLLPSLRNLAQRLTQAYHIPVELRIQDGIEALTPLKQHHLFRFAQEALANALRHSGAKQIELEFRVESSGYYILVKDDGCGFKPEERGRGMGLLNMKERANSLGGKLTINSIIGQGTTLQMWLPRD